MKTFLIGLALIYAPSAFACINDTDCGATCGGMVCSFAVGTYQMCVAASTGDPGWCTSNAGCQCPGATCSGVTHYCSYTTPPDGGAVAMPDLSVVKDAAVVAQPDLTALPDLSTPPKMQTTTSSSGCDVGGGAPPAGLLLCLALLMLARRRARS